MADSQLERKQAKAEVYARQPERFTLRELRLDMRSTHGIRAISYVGGAWRCSCDFFQERGTCSHIMAVERLLGPLAPGAQMESLEERSHDPQ
jgi:hypothetical protein